MTTPALSTTRSRCATGTALLFLALMVVPGQILAQDQKTTYEDHVKAILKQRCASCHGPDSKKGDLDITNFTSLMQGGSSGSVIEPGDPDGSYLYNLIIHEDEPVMPPDGRIPDVELDVIKKWIAAGALENRVSKAVMTKKPAAVALGENPLVRPDFVPTFPRIALEPVQHTERNPVAVSMATSPWAPVVAIAGKNQVVLYDTNTLHMIGLLPFPEGSVNVVRFSRSGSVLLAAGGRAGSSGVAVLWDVASGERIATIGDELDAVLAADISSDHSMVALGGPGRVVNVYATDTGELKYTITKHTDWVTSLAFSTDGVLLASGDRNGGLHVWESWTGRAYLTLKGHTASVNSIAWRADSNVVASASQDTTIRLWELNNGGQIKSWGAHGGGAKSLAFTRDGRILSTGADRITRLWGQDGGQLIAFAAFPDIATSVAWCDESGKAMAGDYMGEIRVWKPDDGAPLGTLTANPPKLATRLTTSQTQLAEHARKIDPLTARVKAATDSAAAVQSQLDAAVAAKNAAQTAFDEVQTALTSTNAKAQQVQSELTTAQSSLTQYREARPLLEQALKNLADAAAKLPGDESLKKQVTETQQQVDKLAARIQETQNSVNQLQASMQEITSQVKATDERVRTATENLKTTAEKVTALTAQIQPLNQASDAANAELAEAQRLVAAAQRSVQRWQGEIDFIKQLEELATQLAAAQQVVDQRQQQLDAANEALKAAQQKSDGIRQTVSEAEKSVEEIRAAIQAARKIQR